MLTAQSGNTGGLTWQSGTPNLFQGITETIIHIPPSDFNITSGNNFSTYSRSGMGAVRPTAYYALSQIYATFFVPLNYEVTKVGIHASQNRGIALSTSKTVNSSVSLKGTGTSNTDLTLATPYESVDSEYFILTFKPGAVSDRIYGAFVTIQAV